jgi:Bacterial transglutaminase-like N-terminal region
MPELPLITLKIHHRTTYRYREPVCLGPHRLMLRPRESRDLRLISSDVVVMPAAVVTWAQDVSGNTVATATFQTTAENLVIDSVAELQLNAAAWPVFDVAASAIFYPFQYSDDEWIDLGALTIQQYPDPAGRLRGWARAFVGGNPTDPTQGPERRRLRMHLLSEPGGRGHPVADPDSGSRLGILPGFRGPLR